MAKLNNLNSNKFQERKRQVRTYGTKTDLSSTTVERGNTHWTDGSNVNIDGFLGVAGTQRVTGLLDVTGTFNGSGTNNLDGTNNLSGDNNLTGPTTIDGVLTINGDTSITGLLEVTGDTTISGTLDIDGVTTLNNDLNVTNSGEINVGTNMTLTPSADGGSILFQDGSKVTSVGGTVQAKAAGASAGGFTAGLNTATISAGQGFITIDNVGNWSLIGGVDFESNGSKATLTGNLDITGALKVTGRTDLDGSIYLNSTLIQITPSTPTIASPPNLFVSASGRLYRSTYTPPA